MCMGSLDSATAILWDCDFQGRSSHRHRFHREFASEETDTFLNDRRSLRLLLKLCLRESTIKVESTPVIEHREVPVVVITRGETDNHVSSAAMFPHVRQRFLHNTGEFGTGVRRKRNSFSFVNESR